MDENIKRCKQQKAQIKGSFTRIQNYIASWSAQDGYAQLHRRREKLIEKMREFETIQTELLTLGQAEETEEIDTIETQYFSLLCKIDELSSTEVNSRTPTPIVSHQTVEVSSSNQLRLPKIDLPKFSGQFDEWYPFFDTFKKLVHEKTSISDIEKFHYLKSSLIGDAAQIIQSLEISDDNYNEAWEMLIKRYDDKRTIVQLHIEALFDLPVLTKENRNALRQLVNDALKHTRALKALKRPLWDDWLVITIGRKLDVATRKSWEASLSSSEMPTFDEMISFLEHHCKVLNAITPRVSTSTNPASTSNKQTSKQAVASHVSTKAFSCPLCNETHYMHQCGKFLKMSVEQRLKEAKSRKLCLNCLKSSSHFSNVCNSGSCKKCNRKHNTLLHISRTDNSESVDASEKQDNGIEQSSAVSSNVSRVTQPIEIGRTMLATAIVEVADVRGNLLEARALLDPGSQSNFITDDFARRLALKRTKLDIAICGISGNVSKAQEIITIEFKSRYNSFTKIMQCLILPEITHSLPFESLRKDKFEIPANINLADPNFNVSSRIDLLIGIEVFWDLLCVGQIKATRNHPCIQKTLLGWVISGPVYAARDETKRTSCNLVTNAEINTMLSKFWEIDDCFRVPPFSKEEKECEEHFVNTYTRDDDGRFVVFLPTKDDKLSKLGASYDVALKRFHSLERKLKSQLPLKKEYISFIHEYEALNHMRLSPSDSPYSIGYCMPHHAVIKQDSLTTRLRVVFDASCKTSSGISLNDALKVGPTIQQDLFSILARFRTYTYVLTADIQKMYRQIRVHDDHTKYQRILWRDNENDSIKIYDLLTVTYGTSPASFLATRCLHEIATIEQNSSPVGSAVIKRDFYVDDLITGADNLRDLRVIRDEVTNVLDKAGFRLHKWASNCEEIFDNTSVQENSELALQLCKQEDIKTLGIRWNPREDILLFSVSEKEFSSRVTKRRILSAISRIFDPLGLIGPVIVTAKILLQCLWVQKADWDESVPIAVQTRWIQYESEMHHLNKLRITRCVTNHGDRVRIDLHGFSDASEAAYGACLYLAITNTDGSRASHLLCSKSRVAPVKPMTLPRLELCGALLLARLINKVNSILTIKFHNVYCWTDSTIVLGWLKSSARNWVAFVANRVGEIQELLPIANWSHVDSKNNPADLISRGVSPLQLLESSLWWYGPISIIHSSDYGISQPTVSHDEELPEARKSPLACMVSTETKDSQEQFGSELFNRYSSFGKLIRVTAYCLRFIKNARIVRAQREDGFLKSSELSQATQCLVKLCQQSAFPEEIKALRDKGELKTNHGLLKLNPFLDAAGIMRVAGRLRNARLTYDQAHPMILPKSHVLTKLIIEYEHKRNLHAGIQLTLYAVRFRYWPVGGRGLVRKIVHNCITCFKCSPRGSQYIMAHLPSHRVTPARPFANAGIDYCGPFYVKEGARRNARSTKAYISIFVCLATKAVHLELVSDMTTEAFINALKRFMARRGKPANIYSDNGSNFVGANRELEELREAVYATSSKQKIADMLTEERINWHFIPPRAPHFGGLWEAAVKAAKYHLKRIVGEAALRFEEMYTLLVQIEAVLNSRPLTPVSSDPNDFLCLTPGHFLIGDSITSNAEPDITDLKINRLSRCQYIEQLRQHFWKRWSREYLSQLQQRPKWISARGMQLQPGQWVIVRDENLPPLRWIMGRVDSVLPGTDGIIRAAFVKTSSGLIKRPTAKLCILPTEQEGIETI